MTTWTIKHAFPDATSQKEAEWVAMMMTASESTAARTKITPEAIVAQGALESGWGAATVGRFGLFGVKAGPDWKGARVLCRTREFIDGEYVTIDDWFRDYDSAEACIEDHFAFLNENSRYRDAGVFAGKGDDAYFAALKAAGYATDTGYVASLEAVESTIRSYFLERMTPSAAPMTTAATPAPTVPRTLMVGCTGADVAALQRRLNIMVDSSFGLATRAAVMAWQADHELSQDGVVGPKTRAALGI